MIYSGPCSDWRTLAAMWLIAGLFTLVAISLILWRATFVVPVVFGWVGLTLNQLTYLNSLTPHSLLRHVAVAVVLSLLLPVVVWLVIELQRPDQGLYSHLARTPRTPRFLFSGSIGAILAVAPALVLLALGYRLAPPVAVAAGTIGGIWLGEAKYRKAAA